MSAAATPPPTTTIHTGTPSSPPPPPGEGVALGRGVRVAVAEGVGEGDSVGSGVSSGMSCSSTSGSNAIGTGMLRQFRPMPASEASSGASSPTKKTVQYVAAVPSPSEVTFQSA